MTPQSVACTQAHCRPNPKIMARYSARLDRVAKFLKSRGPDGAGTGRILDAIEPSNQSRRSSLVATLSTLANKGLPGRYGIACFRFYRRGSRGVWLWVSSAFAERFRNGRRTCSVCGAEKPLVAFELVQGDQIADRCAECAKKHRDRESVEAANARRHTEDAHIWRPTRTRVTHCPECYGIPDRRPKRGLCSCGRARAADVTPRPTGTEGMGSQAWV